MTDRENLCREFTELTGGHWHEWTEYQGNKCKCGLFRYRGTDNPTYDNPADVLRVMMVRDDWFFMDWKKCEGFIWKIGEAIIVDGKVKVFTVELPFIIEPDALLKAAVEFLREGKK
jgi:hypothetical protein